ncbi:MAG: prepilin-type N-terminal cleavage/methylation domain-containing protein [Candidatus Aminicenantes bacterium]|nr:prepilin-type N-terminal cleavage/methylation domain-containing protein [Candidatus Aminicenantes bacterium]
MKLYAKEIKGFTLIEMLVTLTIISILAAGAIPLAKISIKRQKEIHLQRNLRMIREAIDEYKRLADDKKIDFEEDTFGYPPDLETLVMGVEIKSDEDEEESVKIRKFLRRIPKDPMSPTGEWGLRSYQDEFDSDTWGGENVYDVYSKSEETAINETKYKDW